MSDRTRSSKKRKVEKETNNNNNNNNAAPSIDKRDIVVAAISDYGVRFFCSTDAMTEFTRKMFMHAKVEADYKDQLLNILSHVVLDTADKDKDEDWGIKDGVFECQLLSDFIKEQGWDWFTVEAFKESIPTFELSFDEITNAEYNGRSIDGNVISIFIQEAV